MAVAARRVAIFFMIFPLGCIRAWVLWHGWPEWTAFGNEMQYALREIFSKGSNLVQSRVQICGSRIFSAFDAVEPARSGCRGARSGMQHAAFGGLIFYDCW